MSHIETKYDSSSIACGAANNLRNIIDKEYTRNNNRGNLEIFSKSYTKNHNKGYRIDSSKYQHVFPALGTGNLALNSHPKINFSIKSCDGETSHADISVTAYCVDKSTIPEDSRQNKFCDASLTRDTDSCSSINIVARDIQGIKIPEYGKWDLEINGSMELKKGKIESLSSTESGYYDAEYQLSHGGSVPLDNGVLISIGELKTSQLSENDYDNNNIPKTYITLNIMRSLDGGYFLKSARICFLYDKFNNVIPAAQTSYHFRDNNVLKYYPFKNLLSNNNTLDSSSSSSSIVDKNESNYSNFEVNKFGVMMKDKIEYLQKKYKFSELSVIISKGSSTSNIFESHQKKYDSKKLYGFGNISRSICSSILLKLLNSPGRNFDWSTRQSDCYFVSCVLLKGTKLGKRLHKLYMNKFGLAGPTLLQLLTNTSGLASNFEMPIEYILDELDNGNLFKKSHSQGEKELVQVLKCKQSLLYYPGSKIHDSSVGWAIISCIIKRLAGSSNLREIVIKLSKEMLLLNCGVNNGLTSDDCNIDSLLISDAGLSGSVYDLHNFMKYLKSPNCPGYIKTTLIPTYGLSNDCTISVTPGNWMCAQTISKKETRHKKFTLLNSVGWTPYGDSSMACFIEEFDLNLTVCFSKCKAEVSSDVLDELLHFVPKTFKKCSSIDVIEQLKSKSLSSVEHIIQSPLPPYWSKNSSSTSEIKVKQQQQSSISSYDNNDTVKVTYDSILNAACNNEELFSPLIGNSRIDNFMNITKMQKNKKSLYFLNFSKSQKNLLDKSKFSMTLVIKYDKSMGCYRTLDYDRNMGDVVQIYYSKSKYNSRVSAIQVLGVTYCNNSFVEYQHSKIYKDQRNKINSLKKEEYSTRIITAKDVEHIGSPLIVPAVLGGLALAGAGYVAGRHDNYYNGYHNNYDPYYDSNYYYNPTYVPPIWINSYRRRYFPRRYWNPLWNRRWYGGRRGRYYRRPYTRRGYRPLIRPRGRPGRPRGRPGRPRGRPGRPRGRPGRPGRPRGRPGRPRGRPGRPSGPRRIRRRSHIAESIDNHNELIENYNQ